MIEPIESLVGDLAKLVRPLGRASLGYVSNECGLSFSRDSKTFNRESSILMSTHNSVTGPAENPDHAYFMRADSRDRMEYALRLQWSI